MTPPVSSISPFLLSDTAEEAAKKPDHMEFMLNFNVLRACQKIPAPSGLSFCPSAVFRKGLHTSGMRPFPRLAGGQNSCAI
jgi:hypothetical protein